MIVYCKFCRHFNRTGQDEFGFPYEYGGLCMESGELACYAEQYCNGMEDACTKFECDLEAAQKIILESNNKTLEIRDEYKKLHDKYRDLCEKSAPDTVQIKAEMLDMIINAKAKGVKNCGIMNMIEMAELGLKWRTDNG